MVDPEAVPRNIIYSGTNAKEIARPLLVGWVAPDPLRGDRGNSPARGGLVDPAAVPRSIGGENTAEIACSRPALQHADGMLYAGSRTADPNVVPHKGRANAAEIACSQPAGRHTADPLRGDRGMPSAGSEPADPNAVPHRSGVWRRNSGEMPLAVVDPHLGSSAATAAADPTLCSPQGWGKCSASFPLDVLMFAPPLSPRFTGPDKTAKNIGVPP